MEQKEVHISILDMFWTILEQWRLIFVTMIVCAVAVGGLGYIKNYKAYQSLLQNSNKKNTVSEKSLTKNMEEDEIEKVKYTIASVEKYRKLYGEQKEYNSNSILMKENPFAVPTVILHYYIDNHYQVDYPVLSVSDNIDSVKQACILAVNNAELFQKIADEMDSDLALSYYKEIIQATDTERGFNVQITCDNEEDCKKISEIVKEYIDNTYEETFSEIEGEPELTLIQEAYREEVDMDLLTSQQNHLARLGNIKKSETTLEEALSEKEKKYYEYLMEDSEEETKKEQTQTLSENTEIGERPSISIKYVILGLALGVVLSAGGIGLFYILNNRLHRADDIREMYGVEILGTITINNKKRKKLNCIDSFIYRLRYIGERHFSEEEKLKIMLTGIRIRLQKMGCEHLLITGCAWSEATEESVERIRKELVKDGITVHCVKDMIYNVECMMMLQDIDGVIVVETLESTTFQEVEKEVSICSKGEVPILGAIMIKTR